HADAGVSRRLGRGHGRQRVDPVVPLHLRARGTERRVRLVAVADGRARRIAGVGSFVLVGKPAEGMGEFVPQDLAGARGDRDHGAFSAGAAVFRVVDDDDGPVVLRYIGVRDRLRGAHVDAEQAVDALAVVVGIEGRVLQAARAAVVGAALVRRDVYD